VAERLARLFGELGGGAGERAGSGVVIVRAFLLGCLRGPDGAPVRLPYSGSATRGGRRDPVTGSGE